MQVTQDDMRLIVYNNIYPLHTKLEVYDKDGKIIDVISGLITGGSASINADSDIRRTLSIDIVPCDKYKTLTISENSLIWVNRSVRFYIGVTNQRTNEIKYYLQGNYYFTNTSCTYDATTNTLSISCGDFMTALDASKNGQIGGAINTIFYAYDELFLYSWYEDAKADGEENVKNATALFNWAKEYHPNEITETTDTDVQDAVFKLMTTTVDDDTQNTYLDIIQGAYPEPITYQHIDDVKMIVSYNVIRDAVIDVIKAFTNVKDYIIDDIGEIKAIPEYNKDWKTYREEHELWNTIPYDQEFANGSSVLSILTAFRDLYPNYEVFFTEDNVLVFRMIPSFYFDHVTYENQFLQDILISESTSLDMTTVRNMSEIFGKTLEVDFYTEDCIYSDNCYTATVKGYEDGYYNGDVVGIKLPEANASGAMLKINSNKAIGIYDENTDKPIDANMFEAGVQVFKIIKTYTTKRKTETRAYYLGQWQPHAMDVLTDGTVSEETYTDQDGIVSQVFSEQYFKSKYNCNVVHLDVKPDSPFTVQKIGEILDSKSGGEYENISSDSIALEYAAHENFQNSRLSDSITITTKLIPFLDVNIKVEYKSYSSLETRQYIIKSVNHDFDSWTSTITMNRFYPIYDWNKV